MLKGGPGYREQSLAAAINSPKRFAAGDSLPPTTPVQITNMYIFQSLPEHLMYWRKHCLYWGYCKLSINTP